MVFTFIHGSSINVLGTTTLATEMTKITEVVGNCLYSLIALAELLISLSVGL